MRQPREIFMPGEDEEGVYLHLFNRCVNTGSGAPLGNTEKENFIRLIKRNLCLYNIECLDFAVMGDRYHLILFVPKEKLSLQEIFNRVKALGKQPSVTSKDDDYCKTRASFSNDLSFFMRELQQSFTLWFNKTRNFRRKGTLWEQRFKSSKLADSTALLLCSQYISWQSFRSGDVKKPEAYNFSSYGIWQQTGTHPFGESFTKHMLSALGEKLQVRDSEGLKQFFKESSEEVFKSRRSKEPSSLLKSSRIWTDSMVLGEKEILKKEAVRIFGEEKGNRKKFGKVYSDDSTKLLSMRQLMIDV